MAFTLHSLVEEVALSAPASPAVVFGKSQLSYLELDERAEWIASALAQSSVGPRGRVAIYQKKSLPAVAAVLGVLKSGAAYVPIDPKAPPERARFILEHAKARAVVASGPCLKGLIRVWGASGQSKLSLLITEDDAPEADAIAERVVRFSDLEDKPPPPADRRVIDRDLAYILYTSGSTGQPKGVAISHSQSMAFVETAARTFGLKPSDVLASHSAFNFDLSVIDLFCAFAAGASVVLLPEGWLAFPAKLTELIEQAGITVWNSVPSALVKIVQHGAVEKRDLTKLRLIMFAGEAFPLRPLRRLHEIVPHATLLNVYGQTEANSSTFHVIDDIPEDGTPLPIGKPFPNYEVLLIDDAGNAVHQPDAEGELYVRGSAVARGYFGDPERTRAAFVTHPLDPDGAEILYKTGDRAKLDEDGNLIFLGRRDTAIKVRGYRVELRELEARAEAHPAVSAACVSPVPDDDAGHLLVLFVAADDDEVEPALLAVLRRDLPAYMLPDRVVVRAKLPMTGTGKLDRAVLGSQATALIRGSD